MSSPDTPDRKPAGLPRWAWTLILVVAVGSALYFGLWRGYLRRRVFPKNWAAVEAGGVYRSGLIETNLVRRTLEKHGIDVIIALNGRDLSDPKQRVREEAAEDMGIEIHRFPMPGDGIPRDGSIEGHAQAIATICEAREAGKQVVVQCSAGANRTGGIVAYYRLFIQGKDPAEVYEEMVERNWKPDENPGLIDFLNAHMAEMAERLVELGVIESAPDPLPTLPRP
jgi:protein-tyrosine phosphatase